MKYLVVIEKGATSYGAYVPDLPGCVAAGESVEKVRQLIREAIALHLDMMRQSGETIPHPTTNGELIEVSAPAA